MYIKYNPLFRDLSKRAIAWGCVTEAEMESITLQNIFNLL